MGSRFWLAFLVLALALVAGSCSSGFDRIGVVSRFGTVRDYIGEDNELMMDSDINRRQLAGRKYISYGALRANAIPCNKRGQSYYDCGAMKKMNPYTRGCPRITRCKRYTD